MNKFKPLRSKRRASYGLTYEESQRLVAEQAKREVTAADCTPQGQAAAADGMAYTVAFVGVPLGLLGGTLVGGLKGALVGGVLGYASKFLARPVLASRVQSVCGTRTA